MFFVLNNILKTNFSFCTLTCCLLYLKLVIFVVYLNLFNWYIACLKVFLLFCLTKVICMKATKLTTLLYTRAVWACRTRCYGGWNRWIDCRCSCCIWCSPCCPWPLWTWRIWSHAPSWEVQAWEVQAWKIRQAREI